ncbi:hypothetical protein [Nostoc sp. CHAB 5715]|uniref:hypothetical protein n=1 Tax=Nostoc sp. CHAB 5715 TaxID=2780400 RepID=UPI001E63E7AD|nr:hypothetical protein [Nostoc sp. CHAB 5715]
MSYPNAQCPMPNAQCPMPNACSNSLLSVNIHDTCHHVIRKNTSVSSQNPP